MRAPFTTLVLLLAVAVAILIGGSRLARHSEVVRVPGDRAPLHLVAAGMERELERLERLFASHLRQLARSTATFSNDRQAVWRECNRIVGVGQWSLLYRDPKSGPDLHIPIDLSHTPKWPEPTFALDTNGLPRAQVLLPAAEILGAETETLGWIDEPGKPLLFWLRWGNGETVVLLIDPVPIHASLDRWFAHWAEGSLGPVKAARQSMALTGASQAVIARSGEIHSSMPDFLLPLRSRLGVWQLATWDPMETRVRYDSPTQAAAVALSTLVALLGVLGFVQQRRMLALTTQRVTFVNRVSHELRAPLTNILLNLDLANEALEESGATGSTPSKRLALVREEAQRLGRLIENVLTFSRKERGRLRIEPGPCVPDLVIDSVLEQFAPSFARRSLMVRRLGAAPTPSLLDADALAQVLANLLSNVEKYVPGGGVEIDSKIADGMLSITISDEGPGIPASEAERIFKPFERLDSRVEEGASGTGLGLAIARDLCEGMGGTLTLHPSVRGCRFELRVPASPLPALAPLSTP
jgi:signal transduction histidine kinase